MKLKNEKFYLILPMIALPFLCLIFSALGGGKGAASKSDSTKVGINHEIPKPAVDPRKEVLDKMASYEKASEDSMARRKYEQRGAVVGAAGVGGLPAGDARTEDLLRQVRQLQDRLGQQQEARYAPAMGRERESMPSAVAAPEADPQLEKIDAMLDKVMRIQHPGGEAHGGTASGFVDEVLPADSAGNAISVVVPERQVLVTGSTIGVRLEDSVRIGGVVIPSGRMVYGVVSISNDRMLVHINAIRSDRNIYSVDLQVYDLDGLPGIHIPGEIGRDVAKQSADQGMSGVNLMNYDPSIGGQAANAGIQAVKSLLSRKVRQVRVTVNAGYRLLLKDPRVKNSVHIKELPGERPGGAGIRPPGFVPGGPFLKDSEVEGIQVGLQRVCLKDEVLWFGLVFRNNSSITYIPEYTRWFIRDRRAFRRVAAQELSLAPLSVSEQPPLASDSSQCVWTGFRPFALSKGKELVVEVGERNGGRVLELILDHKQWNDIKRL